MSVLLNVLNNKDKASEARFYPESVIELARTRNEFFHVTLSIDANLFMIARLIKRIYLSKISIKFTTDYV